MPGEVIQGHAKWEEHCGKCHEPFSKEAQSRLCLNCHKEAAEDIRSGKGFHGRIEEIEQRACKSCHTEHKGRKADIVQLDQENFDHAKTDFRLKGAHLKVNCASCHQAEFKYREAPSQCIGCHKQDDPHKEELGEKCADCHEEGGWKKHTFDHDKTRFPLKGKHRETACDSCHPDQRYKEIPTGCYACHQLNDVHGGHLGGKCDACHTTQTWKKTQFDHHRDTKFRLEGKHSQLKCESCHSQDPKQVKLKRECHACHRQDDVHKGQHGEKCEKCHTAANWKKTTFDHDRDTDFALRGRHRELKCRDCHEGLYEKKFQIDCLACHKADDVHKGQEGERCERCHNEQRWKEKVAFDHDLARFPLVGLHAIVPCEECHLSAAFKDAELECAACHEKDDAHKDRLGPSCGQCHNPNGWRMWAFDHDKQTDFLLDGAHDRIACESCHKAAVTEKIELAGDCHSCHRLDDAHNGTFGQQCERCHVTSSFRKLKSRLNSNKARQ